MGLFNRLWNRCHSTTRKGLAGLVVLGFALGGSMTPTRADDDWWNAGEDSEVLSTAFQEELEAITPVEDPRHTPQRIQEPTPINSPTFAGEVVDPTCSTCIDDSSMGTAGWATRLGQLGSFSAFGGANGGGARWAGNYSGMVQSATAGYFGNQEQSVVNGGANIKVLEGESWALMSRGLFGVVDDNALRETNFTYSVDSYFGTRIRGYGGTEHWIKVGGFVDDQNQFGKAGPMFAALLFANEAFPVTIDAALGFGYGDDVDQLPVTTNIVEVANRDYQLRVGTFLSPTWQVGISSQVADWEGGSDNRSWGVGAFTAMQLFQRAQVNLDFTAGDEGLRGYALVSYLFGPAARSCSCPGECRVDGKQWMMQPIKRDVALQVRNRNVPLVDRLQVSAIVVRPPRQAIGIVPGDTSPVVLENRTFELDICVTNGTPITITNIDFGQNPTVTGGNGAAPQGISGAGAANVLAGQQVCTDLATDINVVVPAGAAADPNIFVSFDVTIDGTTRRFTAGPIVVNQSMNGDLVPVQ